MLPDRLSVLARPYWPVVLLGTVVVLATLFHLAVPVRQRWRRDLPGAALTLLLWRGVSALLRFVLGRSVGTTSIHGPLAAPIAVLLWLISVALLVASRSTRASTRAASPARDPRGRTAFSVVEIQI